MSRDHIAIGPNYVSEAGEACRVTWSLTTSLNAPYPSGRDLTFRIGAIGSPAVHEQTVTTGEGGLVDFVVSYAGVGEYEYKVIDPATDPPVPLLRGGWKVRAVIGAKAS